MPAVIDRNNLYSETASTKIAEVVKDDLARVYVPNRAANTVSVIDPATMQVDRHDRGRDQPAARRAVVGPEDALGDEHRRGTHRRQPHTDRPADRSGASGPMFPVDDPYNMYFSPDGKSAIVVAEAFKRLDFRDPNTMALQVALPTPNCAGINHADFTIDGKFVIFTCEFQGSLVKIDMTTKQVVGYLQLSGGGMPQDVRVSPDGKTFYIAEMVRGGVYTVDPVAFTETGFIPTGTGAHGLYPSRDAKVLYVANRGSSRVGGPPNGAGSVSVLDWLNGNAIAANWPVPGGGSPDMGGVTRRRLDALAGRPLRQRDLRDQHHHGRVHDHPGRARAARTRGLAPAGPVLAGAHREPSVATRQRSASISPWSQRRSA